MSTGATAGGAAAAAAAHAAKRKREEEEDMTGYGDEDLEGWEFKIVRSHLERFTNYNAVQKLCAEEAQAGWEMVEKFDNGRIRFKRRIEERAQDSHRTIDPYRSHAGMGSGKIVGIVLSVVALTVGLIVLLVTYFEAGN